MTRGARSLTAKEKTRAKLDILIDSKQWRLEGVLVKGDLVFITPAALKVRADACALPYPKHKIFHNRHVIILSVNIWAEEILPGDEE